MKKCVFCLLLLLAVLAACTDYDYDTPDTAANRAGFERHFGFTAPDGVTDTYYFVDEMGSDSLYQLGFQAAPETIVRIVDELDLELADEKEMGLSLAYSFSWWDRQEIEQSVYYGKTSEDGRYKWALWYHEQSGHAYYLEYSL